MALQTFSLLFLFMLTAVAQTDQSECITKCGNITVPYPFGLDKPECSKDDTFTLTCNTSFTPPILFLDAIPMLNISLEDATAVVDIDIAYACYNKTGVADSFSQNATMGSRPFRFSLRNKFTAIGCDTIGIFGGGSQQPSSTGCLSLCSSNSIPGTENPFNFTEELRSCEGIGCCQVSVPKGLDTLHIDLLTLGNHTTQLETNPCSFGFLSDPSWYRDVSNFSLSDTPEKHISSPVLLDWAIQGNSCKNKTGLICGQNTNCSDSLNTPGYRCSCQEGFEGNPYTNSGCLDINECNDRPKYPCIGKCKNTSGNYTCECPFGRSGDGKKGCSLSTTAKIIIGIGALVLFAIFVLSLLLLHKNIVQQLNHRKNGGSLFQNLNVKIFKEAELEKATNKFDAKNLLGKGGFGSVYKGVLEEGTLQIAVKKSNASNVADPIQIKQFANEADIVFKINHKNVVKLLGLCVDSKVPMLVYDFIPNGTLHQHLHKMNSQILVSWRSCLRIASETARALDYMHHHASPPVIHRDIKPSNILLDNTYTAKIADFGASKLIPLDRTMASTKGQGTWGYIDPEYFQTGDVTTMTDVYAFGVVLMELLTKQEALSETLSGEKIVLVKVFTAAVENNQLDQVLKVADVAENETQHVRKVAELAIRCVAMPGNKRPPMSEVARELNGMCTEYQSFPIEEDGAETINRPNEQEITTETVYFEISQN